MGNWRDVLNIDLAIYKSERGNQLKGFLEDNVRRIRPQFLFDGAQELRVSGNELVANPDHSLGLLVYAGLNPQIVKLGPTFESLLTDAPSSPQYSPDPNSFFQGSNVVLPKNSALNAHFKSFEQWTAVNEVKHVSMWLLAAVRSLYGVNLPSTLEVEIPLPGEARSGRLDVVAKVSDKLICFESKTSISDAVREGRYTEQVPKYRQQILQTCHELGHDSGVESIYMVTGGSESDLKCIDGELKATAIGQKFRTALYTESNSSPLMQCGKFLLQNLRSRNRILI